MRSPPFLLTVLIAVLAVTACDRKAPEPQPADSEIPVPAATPVSQPASSPSAPAKPSPPPTTSSRPVVGSDPNSVVQAYADALARRDWRAAASAWGAGSGVTAATLKAAYDRPDRPKLEVGKGTVEGAAGSLYYEAPVVLRFGGSPPERGSLTLRRVNDVPGATAEQLRWHIERATIGVGQ